MNELFKHKAFWVTAISIIVLIGVIMFVRWMSRIAPRKGLLDDIKVNPIELTFPMSQYTLFADQLFGAMDGTGTDERAIEAVMKQLQSRADWDQLVKTYGVRKLTHFGFITTSNGTLPTNLRSELTSREMEKYVNVYLRNFGVSI